MTQTRVETFFNMIDKIFTTDQDTPAISSSATFQELSGLPYTTDKSGSKRRNTQQRISSDIGNADGRTSTIDPLDRDQVPK